MNPLAWLAVHGVSLAEYLAQLDKLDSLCTKAEAELAAGDRIDGTLILAGDLMVTCAVPAVVPDISDVVVIDGVDHAVKRVEAIPAAGTAAAYKLFVGK
jgi:hypothetical protein